MIGLCGAHRVGKSSLAREYAKKFNIPFIETSVSAAVFSKLGLDPSVTYDFPTRLTVQEEILKHLDGLYSGHIMAFGAITDRTPLDLLGYTLAEAIGHRVPPECQARLKKYVEDCFEMTNRRFGTVILVQPGIPLVHEERKAAMNEGYIEHLNSLILGLTVDERLDTAHYYIPRQLTDMSDRVEAVNNAVHSSIRRVMRNRDAEEVSSH